MPDISRGDAENVTRNTYCQKARKRDRNVWGILQGERGDHTRKSWVDQHRSPALGFNKLFSEIHPDSVGVGRGSVHECRFRQRMSVGSAKAATTEVVIVIE